MSWQPSHQRFLYFLQAKLFNETNSLVRKDYRLTKFHGNMVSGCGDILLSAGICCISFSIVSLLYKSSHVNFICILPNHNKSYLETLHSKGRATGMSKVTVSMFQRDQAHPKLYIMAFVAN